MGKNHRPDRLASEIKKKIGEMLVTGEIKDPRLTSNIVNITEVKVSSDGSYATCYVTTFPLSKDENEIKEQRESVISGLNSAKGMIRREIGKILTIRRVPELSFKLDEAEDYGNHIEEILATLPFDTYHAVDPNEVEEEEI